MVLLGQGTALLGYREGFQFDPQVWTHVEYLKAIMVVIQCGIFDKSGASHIALTIVGLLLQGHPQKVYTNSLLDPLTATQLMVEFVPLSFGPLVDS